MYICAYTAYKRYFAEDPEPAGVPCHSSRPKWNLILDTILSTKLPLGTKYAIGESLRTPEIYNPNPVYISQPYKQHGRMFLNWESKETCAIGDDNMCISSWAVYKRRWISPLFPLNLLKYHHPITSSTNNVFDLYPPHRPWHCYLNGSPSMRYWVTPADFRRKWRNWNTMLGVSSALLGVTNNHRL